MKTKKIGWGLLSTAKINRRLIGAIRRSPRGEVVAVASRTQEKAEAYAADWGISLAFGSYQALLETKAVEAIYVSLPNHLHAEWAIAALQHGKHVLCEKPLALSLADTERMIATAAETGLVLAEAFMYLHHPQTQMVAEWVQAGRLGEITLVRATLDFTVPTRQNIRLVPEYGGGALWDTGSYGVSFAQFVLGRKPSGVQGSQIVGDTKVDEFFAGQMHYPNGAVAQISASLRTPYYQMAEITGTTGRIHLTRPFSADDQPAAQMIFFPVSGDPTTIPIPAKDNYLGQVEAMHRAILDGEPKALTLSESRDHIRTLLALYQSARHGQPVQL